MKHFARLLVMIFVTLMYETSIAGQNFNFEPLA